MELPVSHGVPFLFVGNQTCLDFINTDLVINGQPTDLLTSYQDLITWFVQVGLLKEASAKPRRSEGEGRGAETLKEAKVFRTTMRNMAERLAAGKPVPQAALDAINRLLRHRVGHPQISRLGDSFERTYETRSDNGQNLLALLAEGASDLLCHGDLKLVKKCQNPSCVLFFYDTTKNHARRWCSMSLCGNRRKVAAHYHRHRKRQR
jgi:predicted RNA-binding Zn ribbon-like protein